MRFSVDGWDPSYGASFEVDGELGESTARIDPDVELPAARWRAIDPDTACELPEALLFVDGVRRVEAQVWIDTPVVDTATGEALAGEPAAALCASYAAGAVCCCKAGAHLVTSERERGLFSVAPHADDIVTRAGSYRSYRTTVKPGKPAMAALSAALQGRLGQVEERVANAARGASEGRAAGPGGHHLDSDRDLLVLDGSLRGRQHLPRALGYIKSHQTTYLHQQPELNALVGRLTPGQRTPVFEIGTKWDRRSWYLRLPGPPGHPWAGVVRIECSVTTPMEDAVRLAALSQRCLGRFASDSYKDSRAPQNLYPIAGLERELRRRLGDAQLLYRALRAASRS